MSSEIQELSPQGPLPNIRRCLNDIPEEESLRHIIRTRFVNGMAEDFIAIILRDILKGLYHLHVSLRYGYENTNARDIYVSTDQKAIAIGLAYVETRPLVQPGNPWELGRSETDGIWGLGIIALELAYGSLPRNCTGREQLISMANNLVRILSLKLENDDDVDDEKETEKAKKKEKENEKLMIKLPELEKLLDDVYVESLAKKLLKEKKDRGKMNPMAFLKKAYKKVADIFRKNDDEIGREFSGDFLQVVMELLDKKTPTPALMILAHPFLRRRQPSDRARFELSLRGEAEG